MKNYEFSNKWFTDKTKLYYEITRNNRRDFKAVFEKIFNIDYRLVFANMPYEDSLYELLESYYKNEEAIKINFVSKKIKSSDSVTFFELPINKSRIDIVSVNGKSVAYEVKTKYDTLERLNKQITDYLTCFEYVYVIVSFEKLKEALVVVPDCVGIYTYDDKKNKLAFSLYRAASFSNFINKDHLLKNFNKKYLLKFFNSCNIDVIQNEYSLDKVNCSFKQMIKEKYQSYSVTNKK